MTSLARRRAHIALAAIALGVVMWVLLAFPWLERVECLRSGPWGGLKTLTVAGDLGIWLPYMVMPVALLAIWRRMRARPEASLLVLYGSFILLCGLTHLLGVITILDPVYWIAAKLKIITAAVSFAVMVVTIAKRREILALGESGVALAREAEAARAARVDAERQTKEAQTARSELAAANQLLSEMNTRFEESRERQAIRAETAETRNADLQEMVERLQAQDRALAAQDEQLRTLEAPILEALDGVLVSVLVGAMSSDRAAAWTERLVSAAHQMRARVVVLDVTGLLCIDTAVAAVILRTVKAIRIIGGECIMTGVRPEVAQTIVGLGVDLEGLSTLATLRQGLERAARRQTHA